MTRPIGYYVHHQGDGHRQRAMAIAAQARGRIVLLGTGLEERTCGTSAIDLPDDRMPEQRFDGRDGTATRPGIVHYAPLDHDGIRRRIARVAGWIADVAPALMVIDVSVEIALLARLASVPTIPVRLSGLRDDPPHRHAFACATAILAPFHAALDDPATDPDVRAKTLYAPGLTRRHSGGHIAPDRVLVVLGRGGDTSDGEIWAAAAHATPGRHWRLIGPCTAPRTPPANLELAGWIGDPEREIASAGIVVGAAGDGVVGAVLAHRRPFLCLPEERPFDEQRSKARALANAGAAIVREIRPQPQEWRALLERAAALDPAACARLDDPDGARHAANRLLALADGAASDRRSA